MKISQMENDHVTVCLNPQPNKPYERLVVLQKSDRSRSMDEGNVLDSGPSSIEVEERHLLDLLRRQFQDLVYSPGSISAKQTVLGVLGHGIPMTLLEIASFARGDIPEIRRDLSVLRQLGLVEVDRNPKGELLYQISRPTESTHAERTRASMAKLALG